MQRKRNSTNCVNGRSKSRMRRINKMERWQLNTEMQSTFTPPLSNQSFGDLDNYLHYDLPEMNEDNFTFSEVELQDYLDIGDMSCTCKYCGAVFWYEERSEKTVQSLQPDFSLCCMKGKILLPLMPKPPQPLNDLVSGVDNRGAHFMDNIRSYNSMFAFTSIGGKVENEINNGGGPPQFIISGQNYHRIGSLLPIEGERPKFAQLYIYDTQNEVENRLSYFSGKQQSYDSSLVHDIMKMIDDYNVLAKTFRRVRDSIYEEGQPNISLRLFRNRLHDPRTYNLPTIDEIAALIVGDFDSSEHGRDIIVRCQDGDLQRIHETHTSYMPLQYPILFPYGENGFQENIAFRGNEVSFRVGNRKRVSLCEYISFRIQERIAEDSTILKSRRLFQQFVVDCYSMVESQRLSYIKQNQHNIRKDFLFGLEEAVHRGDVNPSSIGSRIVLPSSFTGGKRYMFNNCQDAMAISKVFGYPDLFLTVTCNPKWPEIQRFVTLKGLNAYDRPDISCRVFKVKLDQMMADFKRGEFFGKVNAGMYTIEFQKRGLPHAHILLWLHPSDKLRTPDMIDLVISAELPDPVLFPRLFELVSSFMLHGPCGVNGRQLPCMKNGKCSKFFPKKYVGKTTFDRDGYPIYRRRDTGVSIIRKEVELDNRFVVPYNPSLLMKYQAHINLEYCNKSNSIKCLFKYVNKGVDRVTVAMGSNPNSNSSVDEVDEIKQYYDCRYLSPCESVWRIFRFDIHHRWPPVQKLQIHLPHQQVVVFRDHERIDNVLARNSERKTMFLSWMDANKKYSDARKLTYGEFPSAFIYDKEAESWRPRKRGYAIGRMNFIPPGTGELYYLRLLLNVQRGSTSYEALRTVNDVTYNTFQEACAALGLLADDKEFVDGIMEASTMGTSYYLRKLFVTLLIANVMSKPSEVWDKTWKLLADDILYQRRTTLCQPDLVIEDECLKNLCLLEIEKILIINGKSLRDFDSMPSAPEDEISELGNVLIFNELNYDINDMNQSHDEAVQMLNEEQKLVYDEIVDSVNKGIGGFFFVYGYGGTGKTFLWKTLSFKFRAERKIVLNVASSGIASLLLPGGRTAHSQFGLPLTLDEDSSCRITQGSAKAELLQSTSLIIWDEAPMVSKWAFEAFDRTMRDLMRFKTQDSMDKPFGGKVVVLGGDFRQILPVIPKAGRAEIVMSTINSSKLWCHCNVLTLKKNMRLQFLNDSCHADEVKSFAEWILSIGDGNVGLYCDGESDVEIPKDLLIPDSSNRIDDIVSYTYPNLIANYGCVEFFQDRAILAPTLDIVNEVNEYVMELIPGEEKMYLSSDTIWKVDDDVGVQADWLTTEFLNGVKCSGIPDHKLILKKGVPIMLMRNLDISSGLCNGTRLIIDELGVNVIGARVITGNHLGNKVYIPRMNLIPSDHLTPLKFQRRQFPITVCFAMTINKSQ